MTDNRPHADLYSAAYVPAEIRDLTRAARLALDSFVSKSVPLVWTETREGRFALFAPTEGYGDNLNIAYDMADDAEGFGYEPVADDWGVYFVLSTHWDTDWMDEREITLGETEGFWVAESREAAGVTR